MKFLRKMFTHKKLQNPEPCSVCDMPYKSPLAFRKIIKEFKLY